MMKIFAISDLHLSLTSDKPMDVFGSHWKNHHLKIAKDWKCRVSDDDLVLLPGDHSWALKLEEAVEDLAFIASLPGKKVLLKGNHDLWWQSRKKLEEALPDSLYIIQNDALSFDGFTVAGTRGWLTPYDESFVKADEKIFQREQMRLRMSLDFYKDRIINVAMLHYPPITRDGRPTAFADILSEYKIKTCIYGHLHGSTTRFAFEGNLNGVDYHLVSADHLDFKLLRLS